MTDNWKSRRDAAAEKYPRNEIGKLGFKAGADWAQAECEAEIKSLTERFEESQQSGFWGRSCARQSQKIKALSVMMERMAKALEAATPLVESVNSIVVGQKKAYLLTRDALAEYQKFKGTP